MQFSELHKQISGGCSVLNCTYHYAYIILSSAVYAGSGDMLTQ